MRMIWIAMMTMTVGAGSQALAAAHLPLPAPRSPVIAAQATVPLKPTRFTQGAVEVESPWSRAAQPGQHVGAVYMVLRNTSDSPLVLTGATTPVAGAVQLHDTKLINGYMQMSALDGGLTVAPKSEVELRPGGLHLMLVGLKKLLRVGDTFPVTLTFADGTQIDVTAVIWDVGQVRSNSK